MQSAISGRRILRLLVLIPMMSIGLLMAGVGLVFLRSDVRSFRPRMAKIRQMVEVQKLATPALPPFLIQCLHAGGGARDHVTARCLLIRYGLSETDAWHWHARTLFWSWSLYWHLSEADRDLLYCACLNDGAGQTGIHHLSMRLHGRPVEKLTEAELASLAVASRSPIIFLKNRPRLDIMSGDLLRSIKDG
ncbi:MAG: hypothetical protein WAW39_01515 [Prosthecobacter sp.]|uniref:hypothetical protein n=1 Tax=Prosthecobacter sp. TaxID=1965333 RepID=UPI003BAEBF5F